MAAALWGFPGFVHAAYTPSITCPEDGTVYAIIVKTMDDETQGTPSFDPNKSGATEYCVPTSVTAAGLKALGVISDGGASVQKEIRECSAALTGGTDNFDWDDDVEYDPLDKFSWDKHVLRNCLIAGTGGKTETKTVRVRYAVDGAYLYYIQQSKAVLDGKQALETQCQNRNEADCNNKYSIQSCFYYSGKCYDKSDASACPKLNQDFCNNTKGGFSCAWIGNACVSSGTATCEKRSLAECTKDKSCVLFENACATYATLTPEQKQKILTNSTNDYLKTQYPVPEGYKGFLPPCAFSGTCDNINDLLQLMINVAKFAFGFIGTVAFAMFVYGGFTMVLSMGNADQVKKGREVLVAAVIGIIIAFSAYILIDFVLDALNASNQFRAIGILQTK